MEQSRQDFPVFVYIYDANGRYGKPVKVDGFMHLEDIMKGDVATAVREGREVRICDVDDFLVFHAENGTIKHPPV